MRSPEIDGMVFFWSEERTARLRERMKQPPRTRGTLDNGGQYRTGTKTCVPLMC